MNTLITQERMDNISKYVRYKKKLKNDIDTIKHCQGISNDIFSFSLISNSIFVNKNNSRIIMEKLSKKFNQNRFAV